MEDVTANKATAREHGRCNLHKISTLFRCLEALAAAALLLSWSSAHLSLDLLRRFTAGLLGPRLVFLLANAIVILLLADFGRLSPLSSDSASTVVVGDGVLNDEFLEVRRQVSDSLPPPSTPAPEVFEEKVVMCMESKQLRRSLSERTTRGRKARPELRRSETAVAMKEVAPAGGEEEDAVEFRRTIEAFLAKQTMFRREEWIKTTQRAALYVPAAADAACSVLCSSGSRELTVLE